MEYTPAAVGARHRSGSAWTPIRAATLRERLPKTRHFCVAHPAAILMWVRGMLRDHPDGQGVARVGAREAILDEQVVALPVSQHFRIQAIEAGWRHGLIHGPPLHGGVGSLVAYDELVLGRAAGKLSGAHHVGATRGEQAFVAPDRVLQQLRRAEIPVSDIDVANPVFGQAVTAGPDSRVGGGGRLFGVHKHPYRNIVAWSRFCLAPRPCCWECACRSPAR